jgi:hypothetical protein
MKNFKPKKYKFPFRYKHNNSHDDYYEFTLLKGCEYFVDYVWFIKDGSIHRYSNGNLSTYLECDMLCTVITSQIMSFEKAKETIYENYKALLPKKI